MNLKSIPEPKPLSKEELILMPISAIPPNVPLPYQLYIQINQKFVLFRVSGDVLSTQRVEAFTEKSVETVYILKVDWENFLSILHENLDEVDVEHQPEIAAEKIRHLLFAYGKILENQVIVSSEQLATLVDLSEKLALCINRKPFLCQMLLHHFRDVNVYYVNHQINLALYAASIAKQMDYNVTKLSQLIFTSLMHNVGMNVLPSEARYRPGPLTNEEWIIVKDHPKKSAEILEDLALPKNIVEAVAHHHERDDGTGYPFKIKSSLINPYARIIAAADVLDALRSNRPWQRAANQTTAVALLDEEKEKFDAKIFTFFKTLIR